MYCVYYFTCDRSSFRVFHAEPQPLTSLLWRHRVTWRHQWRNQSIPAVHFPIGSNSKQPPISRSFRDTDTRTTCHMWYRLNAAQVQTPPYDWGISLLAAAVAVAESVSIHHQPTTSSYQSTQINKLSIRMFNKSSETTDALQQCARSETHCTTVA